jgi:pimeloyl-ACP methyl ester carboxylesterase
VKTRITASTLLIAFLWNGLILSAKAQTTVFEGEKTSWHDGFDRYDYIMDENTLAITPFKRPAEEGYGIKEPPAGSRRCILVAPKQAAPGNPWSWQGCYWDHQPQTEVELLKRGFHIAYISATATLKPGKEWDAWYQFLTEKKGLSAKPAFIGMSRGGEYAYTWATGHPDKVSCLYTDNPAINASSLMKLDGLAKNDVALLNICGSIDPLMSTATLPLESIYIQLGGRISIMVKEGFGHHPHSLQQAKPIADFIEQNCRPLNIPNPPFPTRDSVHRWYYSSVSDYRYVPEEKTFISSRGAWFAPNHQRYYLQIPGVEAFTTVLAPAKPAPGNPWVFRADGVPSGSATDLALLDKGYYIVTGAVPYNNDGPVLKQWNTLYDFLTGYGLSKKPVLAGHGAAAGDAVAWAIENPEKVSGIYAINPVLQSKVMTKIPPLDNLAPLAKAHVPVLFLCGSADPSLKEQAMVAEGKYKKLGGEIKLITYKEEGHWLTAKEEAPAIDFVLKNSH